MTGVQTCALPIFPDDQLALAIGKEGLNARLATRLTGWKIDIQSETEFAQAEAAAAFAGDADDEEYSGRCAAILSNGKRCPNAALPGTRYCGVPGHQALATSDAEEREAPAEELAAVAVPGEVGEVAESVTVSAQEPAATEQALATEAAAAEVSGADEA